MGGVYYSDHVMTVAHGHKAHLWLIFYLQYYLISGRDLTQCFIFPFLAWPWARILVQVAIHRRLLIGRDGHLDQSEAYVGPIFRPNILLRKKHSPNCDGLSSFVNNVYLNDDITHENK